MELLIFRTDIKTKKKVRMVKPLLDNRLNVIDWSIDLEDIDNVLRVEAMNGAEEQEIVELVASEGFYCESLPD